MSEQSAQPKSKEVISVTTEGVYVMDGKTPVLQKFGNGVDGDAKYTAVAIAGGFFDPRQEGAGYRPPLAIATLQPEARAKVNEILNGK